MSPFERAFAGLVLGSDVFVQRVRDLTRHLPQSSASAQPAMGALRRLDKAEPEAVEALVAKLFEAEQPRRRRRLVLYALRKHSRLRPTEIARRHERSASAVTLAVRDLDREAKGNPKLATKLGDLARAIGRIKR